MYLSAYLYNICLFIALKLDKSVLTICSQTCSERCSKRCSWRCSRKGVRKGLAPGMQPCRGEVLRLSRKEMMFVIRCGWRSECHVVHNNYLSAFPGEALQELLCGHIYKYIYIYICRNEFYISIDTKDRSHIFIIFLYNIYI